MNKNTMGNILSTIASSILPTIMSTTGTVIKGTGTVHGFVTPFVARVAAKGIAFATTAVYYSVGATFTAFLR